MSVAVIGRGLIGSAAARHLAASGEEVLLIGPGEPAEAAVHRGVFASHYDEGRITRRGEADLFWGRVSAASIARYAEIEAQSGVSFFTECGALMAGAADGPFMARVAAVRAELGTPSERLDGATLAARFPFFRFPKGDVGYYEATRAGHISPRALVRAQGIAAARAGARIVETEARALIRDQRGWVIDLGGDEVRAGRVLVAAGGFTNRLLETPLPLTIYARTVAFFEIGDDEAARLAGMPSLVYQTRDGKDPYLLPPIRYPNGRTYLKLGGDPVDVTVSGDAIGEWFRSGGSAEVARVLTGHIRMRMPGLRIERVSTGACVTTFTRTNRPIIGEVGEGLFVATAGCGRGAKCSDELGRLAAAALRGDCVAELSLAAAS